MRTPWSRCLHLIGAYCSRKCGGCHFHFSIRGNSLQWLFAQPHPLLMLGLAFISTTTCFFLSTTLPISAWAKSEPLLTLDVSKSLNSLRNTICSYYEDSSLSVCSLPLLVRHSGWIWVCDLCWLLGLCASVSCWSQGLRETHLGFPPLLCSHFFLVFLHLPDLTQGTSSSLDFISPSATC